MRNGKLTPEMQAKIVKLIRQGNFAVTACAAVGINEGTYYNWLAWGKKAKSGKYFEFLKSIKKARAEAEALHVQNITKAAIGGTWQASAWMLERKHKKWRIAKDDHQNENTLAEDRMREFEQLADKVYGNE